MTGHFESLINDVPGNADFLTSLAAEWDTYGNHCDGLADDVMSSAHLAPGWAGRAREDFGKSLERQRNRYINLGGDCTTASSAISVYAGRYARGRNTSRTCGIKRQSSTKRWTMLLTPWRPEWKTCPQPTSSF